MKTTTDRKNWLRNFTLGAGLVLASFLIFTGCATPIKTAGTPAVMGAQVISAVPAQTIPQVVPATATSPAVTNYLYVPEKPAVTNYVVVTPAGPPVITGYAPNATTMQAVGYANQAAPLLPAPYGTLLTGVASIAAVLAGWFATKKNNELAAANAAADTHAAAAAAMASVIQSQPALVTAAMTAATSNGSTLPWPRICSLPRRRRKFPVRQRARLQDDMQPGVLIHFGHRLVFVEGFLQLLSRAGNLSQHVCPANGRNRNRELRNRLGEFLEGFFGVVIHRVISSESEPPARRRETTR